MAASGLNSSPGGIAGIAIFLARLARASGILLCGSDTS
uniref:Uncharacterized protein n=1 Tax=Arundo donax TaxID=35708 RepID=A0A0A9I390_ARUDO